MAVDTVRLKELQDNAKYYLNLMLDGHDEKNNAHEITVTSHDAAHCHHDLAILAYLLDADAQSFYSHLYQGASCRRYFLLKWLSGMSADASYVSATVDAYLYDAIASGDEELPVKISRPMLYKKVDNLDSNERFAFSILMRSLIDEQWSERLKKEYENIKSVVNKDDNRLKCVTSILAKDQKKFQQAFHDLISEREKEISSDLVDNEPDKYLFIEGLAILRVARQNDIHIDFDSPQTPADLLGKMSTALPESGYLQMSEREIAVLKKKLDG